MEIGQDHLSIPSCKRTPRGISLNESENPGLFEQLGEDVLLFSEWCQSHCAWRRREYLVVVNELTRIIHKEFSQAQIEVCVLFRI